MSPELTSLVVVTSHLDLRILHLCFFFFFLIWTRPFERVVEALGAPFETYITYPPLPTDSTLNEPSLWGT